MSDPKIDDLLDKIGSASPTNHAIVLALRDVVRATAPEASEIVKYGGLYYAAAQPFCGIFAAKNHVTLEFSRGFELADVAGLLLGDGQYRRHLKFTTPEAVNPSVVAPYVAEALARA